MDLLCSIRRIVACTVLAIIGSKEENPRIFDILVLVTAVLNLAVSIIGLRKIIRDRVS